MKAIVIGALLIGMLDAEELRITVYDRARVLDRDGEAVVLSLSRIFRQSGIEINWVAGVPGAPEASLMIYESRRPGQELELACRARRDIALDILPSAPPGVQKQVLGLAQPLSRAGLNVRIFDDHIREAAARANRTYAIVLSHAVAHEIGHVLLRSNIHFGWGLMADVWTGREYDWMEKGALFFSAADSLRMRVTLSGAACSSLGLAPERE